MDQERMLMQWLQDNKVPLRNKIGEGVGSKKKKEVKRATVVSELKACSVSLLEAFLARGRVPGKGWKQNKKNEGPDSEAECRLQLLKWNKEEFSIDDEMDPEATHTIISSWVAKEWPDENQYELPFIDAVPGTVLKKNGMSSQADSTRLCQLGASEICRS